MKVKNISGSTFVFKAGTRTYSLANAATTTVDDTVEAINDVQNWIKDDKLEVVSPPLSSFFTGSPDTHSYAVVTLESDLVDTDTLTVDSVVFEIDESANGVTGTNVAVTAASSTNNAVTAAGLKAAINANTTLAAAGLTAEGVINLGADDQRLIIRSETTPIADVTVTQAGDGLAITKVAAATGVGYRQTVTTFTASGTTALVNTGLNTLHNVTVIVRSAAGTTKLYDGTPTVAVGGGFVYIPAGSTVSMASTDVVTVVAYGL